MTLAQWGGLAGFTLMHACKQNFHTLQKDEPVEEKGKEEGPWPNLGAYVIYTSLATLEWGIESWGSCELNSCPV